MVIWEAGIGSLGVGDMARRMGESFPGAMNVGRPSLTSLRARALDYQIEIKFYLVVYTKVGDLSRFFLCLREMVVVGVCSEVVSLYCRPHSG